MHIRALALLASLLLLTACGSGGSNKDSSDHARILGNWTLVAIDAVGENDVVMLTEADLEPWEGTLSLDKDTVVREVIYSGTQIRNQSEVTDYDWESDTHGTVYMREGNNLIGFEFWLDGDSLTTMVPITVGGVDMDRYEYWEREE